MLREYKRLLRQYCITFYFYYSKHRRSASLASLCFYFGGPTQKGNISKLSKNPYSSKQEVIVATFFGIDSSPSPQRYSFLISSETSELAPHGLSQYLSDTQGKSPISCKLTVAF
jgi:hypothetical protein